MNKELNTLEVALESAFDTTGEIVAIDNLSLALVGGGEAVVAF